jgi:hypothetical protein
MLDKAVKLVKLDQICQNMSYWTPDFFCIAQACNIVKQSRKRQLLQTLEV